MGRLGVACLMALVDTPAPGMLVMSMKAQGSMIYKTAVSLVAIQVYGEVHEHPPYEFQQLQKGLVRPAASQAQLSKCQE